MRYLIFVSMLVFVLIGCKQEVAFTPQVSTPLEINQPEAIEEVVPLRPPGLNVVERPEDHFFGKSTRLIFEAIKGDSPLHSILCLVDEEPVSCDLKTTRIDLKGYSKGKHTISVTIVDTEGFKVAEQMEWDIFDQFVAHSNDLDIGVWNNQADILFVIDNSISMQEEQLGIANRINKFFEKITNLDWRVGIITTDPYQRDLTSGAYNPLADGALLQFPNGQYFIDSSSGLVEAKKQFSETIFRPERGNGHERGIYNTFRSLERYAGESNSVNDRLKNFFRSQSAFSVVLISDEDETVVNGVGRPLADLAKSEGANLVELVRKTWGEKKLFQFNSVIVRPGESSCIGSNEKFGYAYNKLSGLTDGAIESICAADYKGALNNIGSNVANLQKRYQLDCLPQDIDEDSKIDLKVIADKGQTIPGFIITGKQLEFDSPLKPGQYEFKYFCPLP